MIKLNFILSPNALETNGLKTTFTDEILNKIIIIRR